MCLCACSVPGAAPCLEQAGLIRPELNGKMEILWKTVWGGQGDASSWPQTCLLVISNLEGGREKIYNGSEEKENRTSRMAGIAVFKPLLCDVPHSEAPHSAMCPAVSEAFSHSLPAHIRRLSGMYSLVLVQLS